MMRHRRLRKLIRNNRGAALVEFALVAMLLLTLVFGIIEFGLLIKDQLTLTQAVREGVRSAALGKSITEVENMVKSSATTMDPDKISNIQVSYRIRAAGLWPTTWTSGVPASITSTQDVQMKVGADYAHPMIMGTMFGSNPKTLHSELIMRSE